MRSSNVTAGPLGTTTTAAAADPAARSSAAATMLSRITAPLPLPVKLRVHVGGLEVHPVRLGWVCLAPLPVVLVQLGRRPGGRKDTGFAEHIDFTLEVAQATGIRVRDEHRGLVAGPVHVLRHRHSLLRQRKGALTPDAPQHTVVQ